MTSCGAPAALRELYRTPSGEGLSSAKQYTPSPGMALVTSNSTTWPGATAPTVESTGPSITGCVFEVTVRSFHSQPVIECMRPPATLWEFRTFDTCSRRRADVT